MLFSEIRPYIRFARYLRFDRTFSYAPQIPCDARLFYVLDGEGCIEALNIHYILKKGDVLLINSGIEYHIHTPKRSVSYLALNFDYTYAHASLSVPIPPMAKSLFQPEQVLEHIRFEDMPKLNEVTYLPNCMEIERTLISIEYEYSHRVVYSDIKISSLLCDILIDVCRKIRFEPVPSRSSTETKNISPRHIVNFVYEHFGEDLTNASIGSRFGYHPNYISNAIKEYTGLPLHQYLMHVRIVRATDLLNLGSLSVSEIAQICGFESLNYFSRYFKKCTGFTPTEYVRKS